MILQGALPDWLILKLYRIMSDLRDSDKTLRPGSADGDKTLRPALKAEKTLRPGEEEKLFARKMIVRRPCALV